MNPPSESPSPLDAWSGVADRAGVANCLAWSEAACARLPLDDAGVFALRLAIEEVCVNVGEHGYPPQPPGPMSVTVWQRSGPPGERIEVEIRDRATPFHPDEAPAPDLDAAVSERRVGGLGWYLIRQLMDHVDYQSLGGENCLRLVKLLAPAPA